MVNAERTVFGNTCTRLLAVLLAVLCLPPGFAWADVTAGWIEYGRLIPSGIELKAKLDTGAKHSSINARALTFFQSGGREHVRFKVVNKSGDSVELALPVVRHARIKRHFGNTQDRPVVQLNICIGDVLKTAEVNLVDRTGFNYPLLIGRSFLAGDFVIDSSTKYRLTPDCRSGN